MIPLTRPIVFFDCETTGPNPREDRIVELAICRLAPDKEPLEWRTLVQPTIPIPHEATHGDGEGYSGHGITNEAVKDAPTFRWLAPSLLRLFVPGETDYGGFNVKSYDLPLLQAEFQRAGVPWDYADARILDGYRLWQVAQGRSLSDACETFLGRKHEGAHGALSDVQVSRDVVFEMVRRFDLTTDLAALHALQWPRPANAVDAEGRLLWKDGQVILNFGKKWKGRPLVFMERRDLIWIADKADGVSDEVRQICREAAVGIFPTRPAEAQ